MSWFIFALISLIFFTGYSLLARILSVKSINPRAFSGVFNLCCSFLMLIFFLFENKEIVLPANNIIIITCLMIFLYVVFARVEFFANKYVESSTLTIIGKITPVVTFFASIVFLDESISLIKIGGIGVIILGNILALWGRSGKIELKGIGYAIVMSVSLGLAWFVDKIAASYYPLAFYAFLSYFFSSFFVLVFPIIPMREIRREIVSGGWKICLLAFFNVIGYYSLIKAFTLGEVSRVVFVSSSSSVLTILLAIIFLKERDNVIGKVVAGVLVFVGVLMLK